jgi:hypothetical protein
MYGGKKYHGAFKCSWFGQFSNKQASLNGLKDIAESPDSEPAFEHQMETSQKTATLITYINPAEVIS